MSKVIAIELTREDQNDLVGKLEGIIESLQQARIIEKDHTREAAFDNIEFRLEAFTENLEEMLNRAEIIHIEK
jgi:hypothetical protein